MRRVILLGASNLSINFSLIVRLLQAATSGSLEIYAAEGRGRSFGQSSLVFGRGLNGIRQSRLWDNLPERHDSQPPERVLITDIGNDLMYGVPEATIADWLNEILTRLKARNADVVMTGLPLPSVESLSRFRFHLYRTLLFPFNGTPFDDLLQRVRRMQECVEHIADRHGVALIPLPVEWYGMDPIHIQRSSRLHAWMGICSHWTDWPADIKLNRPTFRDRIAAIRQQGLRQADRRLLGISHRTQQPAWKTRDLTISLY